MTNLTYYPFERNRYFFGKLLTVNDFDSEQKYFNDKRRLINRLVNGSGVVCGLNAVQVGETELSVEAGCALDYAGREIILDTPVNKKLSMFEGFNECMGIRNIYLCVEYSETEKEPVHSIAGTSTGQSSTLQHNKYLEGARLFLTPEEGDAALLSDIRIYKDIQVIYDDPNVKIVHILPKFVNPGEEFNLEIEIFKKNSAILLNFEYKLASLYFTFQGNKEFAISFDDKNYEPSSKYKKIYRLKADNVKDIKGTVEISGNLIKLVTDGKESIFPCNAVSGSDIAEGDIKDHIVKKYFSSHMDDFTEYTEKHRIYLAKISVIHAGSTYSIESVENLPYKQYVKSPALLSLFENVEKDEISKLKEKFDTETSIGRDKNLKSGEIVIQKQKIPDFSSGVEEMDLGFDSYKNKKYFSREIIHGLGEGNVYIILGLQTGEENGNDKTSVVFDPYDIFEGSEHRDAVPKVALGSVSYSIKGTFRIGVKLLQDTDITKLKIRWMAYRDHNAFAGPVNRLSSIHIKPDITELKQLASVRFEAVSEGLKNELVTWSVVDPSGGTIDKNGVYTAPAVEGVYEIIARSVSDPQYKASAFAVVKANK